MKMSVKSMARATSRSATHSAEAPDQSCMVTILGAGRSGTSAITRGMRAIGIDLGDRLRRGRGKNPTGFFEDNDMLDLNRKLKRALGVRADSVRLIDDVEWDLPNVRAIHPVCVDTMRGRFGGKRLWGYKYGRTLRFLPFWLRVWEELDVDVRYVVAVRNPLSVARSRGRLEPRRGTQEKSDLEWLVNIVPYFHLARVRPMVVVDYDSLMADPTHELERMARGLGLPLDDRSGIEEYCARFLKPGVRHSHFAIEDLEKDPHVNPLTRQAYAWLYRMASDEIATDDGEFWADWQRIAGEAEDLRPVLKHIDIVQNDLRNAERSFLGPLQAVPDLWRRLRAIR